MWVLEIKARPSDLVTGTFYLLSHPAGPAQNAVAFSISKMELRAGEMAQWLKYYFLSSIPSNHKVVHKHL
jgi:hypothetical protein